MKKTIALILSLTLLFTLSGCTLFSSGDAGDGGANSGTIAITDEYNHEDPADLEYDQRIALTTGKNAPDFVDGFKQEYDVDFVEQFAVIYSDKDDKVVGEYDYYVFATPEDAQKFGKAFDTESRGGKIEGNVVAEFMDGETVNMIIDINIQYNSMSENTASAYVQFMKDLDAMMVVE